MCFSFFEMGIKEYVGCSSKVEFVEWGEQELMLVRNSDDGLTRVLGVSVFTNGDAYEYVPIPVRFQKNCRAFLRGYSKEGDKRRFRKKYVVDKISFDS